MLKDAVVRWDRSFFRGIFDAQAHRLWVALHRGLSRSADGPFYFLWGLPLVFWGSTDLALQTSVRVLLAFGLELPLYRLIKKGTRRQRPFVVLPNVERRVVPPDLFSFPSGHTAGAFIMASGFAEAAPALAFPLYLWATAVGLSRVALGVHFPSDVLAGAVLGYACSVLGSSLGHQLLSVLSLS